MYIYAHMYREFAHQKAFAAYFKEHELKIYINRYASIYDCISVYTNITYIHKKVLSISEYPTATKKKNSEVL